MVLPLLVGAALALGFAGDAAVTRAGHLMELTRDLESFAAGHYLVHGPELGHTGLSLGGPLFAGLHLPARLIGDPALGLHLCYAGYQALALAVFVLLARRSRLDSPVVWLAALLLAAAPAARSTVLENSVLAAHVDAAALGVLLVASARPRPVWAFATGALMGLGICLHLLAVLPLAGAAAAMAAVPSGRGVRLAALSGGVALVVGAGLGLDLAAPASLTPAIAPPAPQPWHDLLGTLGTPGLLGGYLHYLPVFALVAPGAALAVRRARREPAERALWAGVLAWLAATIVASILAAPEVAGGVSGGTAIGRPLLKFELLGLAPAALLGALALAETSGRVARRAARVGALSPLAAGLLVLAIPIGRWAGAPAEPGVAPEPFFRSASSLAALKRHIAPYRAAGVVEGIADPLRFVAFDTPTRLLALWRPGWLRAGGATSGDTVLVPAAEALEAFALPRAVQAGAMLAVPGCQPLSLEACGEGAWCGDWPTAWEDEALVLLLRFGRDATLTPAGGSPLPGSEVVLDSSWSQAGARGHDFQWLVLAVHRGAGPGAVQIRPSPVAPSALGSEHPPLVRYLYSIAEPPSLRAWRVPFRGVSAEEPS
ncbi:MAG: hypothetical protein ABIO70_31755 [Pseudomonadota bacterium]